MRQTILVAAGTTVLAATLLWTGQSPAQQKQPPPRNPNAPQPAGDAVAPRAGGKKSPADAPNRAPSGGAGDGGTVRTLRLPELESDLPDAPGRKTVEVVCAACHTTRYITIQPPLTRDTWAAEVTKMQKTYGAPVPADKVNEIVEYLVAVRGPQAKAKARP